MFTMAPQHASAAEHSSEEVFRTRLQQSMCAGEGACVRSTARQGRIANTAGNNSNLSNLGLELESTLSQSRIGKCLTLT